MHYAIGTIALFLIVLGSIIVTTPDNLPGENSSVNPSSSSNPASSEVTAFCEQVSNGATFTAPRDDNTKCPNGEGGSYKSGGVDPNNLFGANTTYKLFRRNVPLNKTFFTKEDGSDHSTLASSVGIETSLDPEKYTLYYPQIAGEINLETNAPYSRTRECGERSYRHTDRMYFIDYGLVFALILKDGQPIEITGTAIEGGQATFWLTDVYRDVNHEDQTIPPEAFACDSSTNTSTVTTTPTRTGVGIPQQSPSTDKSQLQMEYFVFGEQQGTTTVTGGVVNGWVDTCKPAVYLYSKQKQLVNVKVFPQGFLTYVDPPYDTNKGWTVEANPDGKLEISNFKSPISNVKYYDYLYYESKIRDEVIEKPEKGYVVKFEQLNDLYKDLLPKLGLNQIQSNDFIEYWNKALPPSPYYFVGVVDQENVDQIEKLEITPKPDYINRVRIYFERLDQFKTVETPDLSSFDIGHWTFDIGHSFRVVEWGGMVKNDKDHPFTCSQ